MTGLPSPSSTWWITWFSPTKKLPSPMWRSGGGGTKAGASRLELPATAGAERTRASRWIAACELRGKIPGRFDAVTGAVERVLGGPAPSTISG